MNIDNPACVTNRIKEFRILYGVSQTLLADCTDLSQTTISSLEKYEYFPTCRNSLKIYYFFKNRFNKDLQFTDVFDLEGGEFW